MCIQQQGKSAMFTMLGIMSLCDVWLLFAIQIANVCTTLIPLGFHSDVLRKLNV